MYMNDFIKSYKQIGYQERLYYELVPEEELIKVENIKLSYVRIWVLLVLVYYIIMDFR